MRALTALSRFVSASFPFWVLLFAILAFFRPAWFLPLTAAIAPLLGLVMFGMGLTLKGEDFREVARHPIRVLIGVLAQFVIMPGLAWLLCRLLQLPAEIAVGVILVGCCPGGTASNVMTWLSRGDVALSVAITSVTTLLAPLVTPALVWLLASAWLPVSFAAMFLSILQVVLVPIALGLLAQRLLGERTRQVAEVLPLVSVFSIVVIIAAVVAASQARIAESGLLIMAVVMLHNGFGLWNGDRLTAAASSSSEGGSSNRAASSSRARATANGSCPAFGASGRRAWRRNRASIVSRQRVWVSRLPACSASRRCKWTKARARGWSWITLSAKRGTPL